MAGKDIISVTFFYKDGSIRVSMGALESFGLPKFIRFLINPSKRHLLLSHVIEVI